MPQLVSNGAGGLPGGCGTQTEARRSRVSSQVTVTGEGWGEKGVAMWPEQGTRLGRPAKTRQMLRLHPHTEKSRDSSEPGVT